MTHYNWSEIPAEKLNPYITRRAIHTPGLTIARLEILKGGTVPEHNHVQEQVSNVERGALQFWFGEEHVVLREGESLAIPSHVPHKVMALEDTTVVDIFTPCREDWIRGDDAYLRR